MGRKGAKSKRGVGEKDATPRNRRISVWVTEMDIILLDAAAKHLNTSKSEIVITILRLYLKLLLPRLKD
jgi:hypothetical protein